MAKQEADRFTGRTAKKAVWSVPPQTDYASMLPSSLSISSVYCRRVMSEQKVHTPGKKVALHFHRRGSKVKGRVAAGRTAWNSG